MGGRIFKSCDVSPENMLASHAVSLAIVVQVCKILQCLVMGLLVEMRLPSLVSPSSYTVLLVLLAQHNLKYCSINRWA